MRLPPSPRFGPVSSDEPGMIELTLVGEAEVQHRIFNLGAGASLRGGATGGI